MDNADAVKEFLVESLEGLDQLDRELVALESDPKNDEHIRVIFRVIHTLKGTSGFLAFSRLEKLTHAGENLLSLLRDGTISLAPSMMQPLLGLIDRVRLILANIEKAGAEPQGSDADLITALNKAAEGKGVEEPKPAAPVAPAAAQEPSMSAQADVVPTAKVVESRPTPTPILPTAAPRNEPTPSATAEPTISSADMNVRVDVNVLDTLMTLVGELVLARNQILQVVGHSEDSTFQAATQRLNLVTTELQGHVMKTRMQPIGNIWSKLPRVVRDLAHTCGKQVRVEMAGRETELDRTVIEAIKDPLTHVVRNAIDHGIETPEVRAAKGKPKTGTLSFRAYHEGGLVMIEISDDGAGLVLDSIRAKAVEKNLVSAEKAAKLSDHELAQLIFLPGFSTAAKVTNVSGRGVGMDVVKSNIEKIGGTVELHSRPGQGTTIRIKIPLTLAIVPALIVTSSNQRYAIPQASLLELVRLEGEACRTAIETLQGSQVYRLRGNLLPIVHLGKTLGLKREDDADERVEALNIIVLQADQRQFGLVVEDIGDTEEIVVKPLIRQLKSLAVFAGATIMGDGRVALILDVKGLAERARAAARTGAVKQAAVTSSVAADTGASRDTQALLLFGVGESTMAVPLALVARLEEFPSAKLERTSSGLVVQHRGRILPLVDVSDALGAGRLEAPADNSSLPVIVYTSGTKSVGLVVSRIIDVIEDAVDLQAYGSRSSLSGAAIVNGRVTDFLDIDALVAAHVPWIGNEGVAS